MAADIAALLKQIARNTKCKSSMQLIISGNKSELTVKYDTRSNLIRNLDVKLH